MPDPARIATGAAVAVAAAAVVVAGLFIADHQDQRVEDTAPTPASVVRPATNPLELVTEDDAALAISRRLFASSQTVVLAAASNPDALTTAIRTATELHVPVLIDSQAAPMELARLRAQTVLTVGDDVEAPRGHSIPVDEVLASAEVSRLAADPSVDLAAGKSHELDTLVTVTSRGKQAAAVANAEAAGATVVEVKRGDPRQSPGAAQVLTARPTSPVIALDAPRDFAYTLDVVRRDAQQPTGGYLALPGKHYTAMYGHPGAPSLGVLGEQGVAASVKRVERLADKYRAVGNTEFVPTFEIIATVASGSAGQDKNYSSETPISRLEPLVDAAEKAGIYVILDLQPGRTDFLTQAKRYRKLLVRPHVGLAVDPEWRLKKKQKHLEQIGSVSASEINRTSAWLAALTRQRSLPQKVFVVHQFSQSMVKDRRRLDTTHAELATVIHVDGSGGQSAKQSTWNHLRKKAPAGLAGWGWKNFVDEDAPMLTARQTWAKVRPHPELITYQ